MRRNIDTTLETAIRVVASLPLRRDARVLDLGCGDGVFLQAAGEILQAKHPGHFLNSDALSVVLTGVEIDPRAAAKAEARLTKRLGKPDLGWDIRISDALQLSEAEKYDFVIGNPPWIRNHDLDTNARSELRSKFTTAKGAFDLCYLFIEKAIRLLTPGGELAVVVPRGIQFQPAAEPLRALLTDTGKWSIEALHGNCFKQSAQVDPGILRYTKIKGSENQHSAPRLRPPVFGDIATITIGLATGANHIFLVNEDTIKKWQLEQDRLRHVVRGRNISLGVYDVPYTPERLIWPYLNLNGSWRLDDLSSSPHVLEYLEAHRAELTHRPRSADFIKRNPSDFYLFIDPDRVDDSYTGMRIAMPVIFRERAFALVGNRRAIVLNSCIEIHPMAGYEQKVLAVLNSVGFWRTLRRNSRVLNSGYRRTSVTELRSMPLTTPP